MWCNRCRQDVPAVASGKEGALRCPRCNRVLRGDVCERHAGIPSVGKEVPDSGGGAPRPHFDAWEFDQQLRKVETALGTRGTKKTKAAYRREVARLDGPHAGPAASHLPSRARPRRSKPAAEPQSPAFGGAVTWLALSLGTMALVCGGVLLVWSLATGRTELWNVGLPVAIGGQVALLIGLILQLDRIWNDNRLSAAQLKRVDHQLHDLKTTTTLIGTSHASPGSAFYAHMADGAGPQMLLTDLKSQLDLLALKISREAED